ncbi:hypothetical protein [Actinomadura latina]|uniref:Uncharacterized protein n=1 Tax=Actinomadura latina TaxID=163603 RepID=A0A846YYV1_9ACTN|nr:hypothetical protein [Actinomadura latina]NKZ03638.1 hypothetical protein [Actinomadura latina]
MTMRRMLVMAGGAVVPIALISLLFGNQWVVDAINDTGLHWDEGIAPPLYWLLFPKWRLSAGPAPWKFVLALDFSTVLFFLLLIGFAAVGARALDPRRGGLGAVVTGWWATVVAGGIGGFVMGVLLSWVLDLSSDRGPYVFNAVSHGAAFGFAYGWLAGIGMLLGYLVTRRGATAQAQQPGQYAPQQPGMPMQQPYGQPMGQRPGQYAQQQAVPYVPPQGQPQQPWGGVPQQPMQQQYPHQQPGVPQQYGAAPVQQPSVPQQPPAPPPEQAPPAAPEAPAEAKQDPPADAPNDPPTDPPADAPEDDDLDLADRTIVDRKRDGEDG